MRIALDDFVGMNVNPPLTPAGAIVRIHPPIQRLRRRPVASRERDAGPEIDAPATDRDVGFDEKKRYGKKNGIDMSQERGEEAEEEPDEPEVTPQPLRVRAGTLPAHQHEAAPCQASRRAGGPRMHSTRA